jgi:hypothetical protein
MVGGFFMAPIPQKLPGPPPHPACERSGHSAVVGGTGKSNKTPWLADFSWRLFRKSYRDLLPTRPVSDLVILPWWVVQVQRISNTFYTVGFYTVGFLYGHFSYDHFLYGRFSYGHFS